ncbi:lamin tail domain-containing protein [Candidatus Gracilibacteria bacterium]|nr:lamin tail domain-containing protein [Candidatus Gracilibacteria bacterium]MCF7898928.1 lamin tail domain-containing protein [Candidatus Paceibacterota bacterium]
MKNILVLLFLISSLTQVHAIYISEIMYDPEGSDTSREWIEIYNDTSSAVDLTSWKFFEGGTNHGITIYSGGGTLQSGAYAIIADNPTKFLADYPSYSGLLYDSAFSLSNTGEHLALKESSSGVEVDSVDYNTSLGGNNGNTLSKINGLWVLSVATPGDINQETQEVASTTSNSTTTTTQAVIAQTSPPTAVIVLYMPNEKVVVAGAESTFSVFGLTRAGININNVSYTWAYGDGGQGVGSSTAYRYAYPGKYIAQAEGGNGQLIGIGRMSVRVVAPDITISKVSSGKYGNYIDISNPNNYDLDFSQWKLSIDGNIFSFPKNTLLAGNSVTHLSGIAMGFASTTIATSTTIKILFPNMEEVTRFSPQDEKTTVSTGTQLLKQIALATFINNKPQIKQKIIEQEAKPQPMVLGTSTKKLETEMESNIKISTNTNEKKDTRLVAFFKSLIIWR